MQPEQSTADTTIQLGIISNSSSERRQRQHGGKRGNAGGHTACAAARAMLPGKGRGRRPEPANTDSLSTTKPLRRCQARVNPAPRTSTQQTPPGGAIRKGEPRAEHPQQPPLTPARPHGGTRSPAPPRRPSPWLTSRKAWVKDGSSESFSAISSGRYFSSMAAAAARSGSGAGAPGAPAGKERVRVPGSGKSSEAALPPGRLPPGAAGTHPEGSAASPRPGGGRKGARAGGTPLLSGQGARTNRSAEAHKEVRWERDAPQKPLTQTRREPCTQ